MYASNLRWPVMTDTAAVRGIVFFLGCPTAVHGLIRARLSLLSQGNRWRRIISYLLCRFSSALMSRSPPVTPGRSSAIPSIAFGNPPHPQPPLKPKAWQSLSRCSYLRNLSLLHLPPSVPCLPHICIPPKVHFSMTNHMGFQQSFKVCCLWETLFSVQHFSIQGNTWLGRQPTWQPVLFPLSPPSC